MSPMGRKRKQGRLPEADVRGQADERTFPTSARGGERTSLSQARGRIGPQAADKVISSFRKGGKQTMASSPTV
jgi:hypothetical protein